MPAKKSSPIRTVAEELANREKCRYGLGGVTVRLGAGRSGSKVTVESTHWDQAETLQVVLSDGRTFPAHQLYLCSIWPVACCEPKQRHRWNTPSA
jgi:hypothetical protein